jgi:hypothetical protein
MSTAVREGVSSWWMWSMSSVVPVLVSRQRLRWRGGDGVAAPLKSYTQRASAS